MFDLEKLKDNNCIFWVFMWPEIRRVAYEHGWAVALHGSIVHDLDLMAMPWVEEHSSADVLAEKLSEVIGTKYDAPKRVIKYDGEKPNNRVVYTIISGQTWIDLNVIKEVEPHEMTWQDIEKIVSIADALAHDKKFTNTKEGYYTEILERFKKEK